MAVRPNPGEPRQAAGEETTMLNREDSELLTCIGPGTPMGQMLREYWVPACRSVKLEREGAPERVRLFGENFVAFRNADGSVGFLAEGCPHRCASLALARNEGDGLRCIFHGWKFSGEGKCLDTPTEPTDRRAAFASRVPVRHHPTHEAGGLLWVYLGKQEIPPRFHDFEFTRLPADQVAPRRGILHCNWLQGLEALLDAAHVTFLHASSLVTAGARQMWGPESDYMLSTGAPVFEFIERPYGFTEGALRDQPNGLRYVRIREVAFPFFVLVPSPPGGQSSVVCSIPIDDEHTAQWYIPYNLDKPIDPNWQTARGIRDSGNPDFFNSDMGGPENMWHQDRKAMKQGHWTGIVGRGNAYEDFIVQESMGPIVNRTLEHLGSCDVVIVRTRHMLLNAVRHYRQSGQVPFTSPSIDFAKIRAISIAYPKELDWRDIDPFNPEASLAA
jgi:phthalate 4,5-dioxygenase